MATVNATEWLDLDGVPLSTPAWTTEDISTLLNGPSTRGSDIVVPGRAGQVARRRTLDAREVTIPIVVNGYVDSDGAAHADPRAGLLANLDELKAVLSPVTTTIAGTRTLTWYGDFVQRTAEVHVNPALDVAAIGPHAARIVVRMTLPGGALRGGGYVRSYANVSTSPETITIAVDGTGEVQDMELVWSTEATWPGPFTTIISGAGAPDSGDGINGDWYIDDDTSELYGPKTAGTWAGYGPFDAQFTFSAPGSDDNIGRAYTIVLDGSPPAAIEVYGPRGFTALGGGSLGTSLKVENLTIDPTGGVYIELQQTVNGTVAINAGTYTATNNAVAAGGAVVVAGTPVWLPLLPGTNTLRVTAPTLDVDAAFGIRWRGVYL